VGKARKKLKKLIAGPTAISATNALNFVTTIISEESQKEEYYAAQKQKSQAG